MKLSENTKPEPVAGMELTSQMRQTLSDFLKDNFGIEPLEILKEGGYSNFNVRIRGEWKTEYVVRISRFNRRPESIQDEEFVLGGLTQRNEYKIPVPIKGIKNKIRLNEKEHYMHVFPALQGSRECAWWEECRPESIVQIFSSLALLHRDLQLIPVTEPFFESKKKFTFFNIPSESSPLLAETDMGAYVAENWALFLKRAEDLQNDICNAFPWELSRWQWIHGDIQLENILFEQGKLSAVLDFELIRPGSCELDLIMSAFRVCKRGATDGAFDYNAEYFESAISAYLHINRLPALFFHSFNSLWKPYFCLDQAMLYLQNAFDGLWKLEPNIGFFPCFQEVLNYERQGI